MTAAAPDLRFDRFELQPRERRLLVDGQEAGLGGRALDVLIALAQRAGQLVSRNELIDLAWPGLVVEENNLSVQISALRKVLGGQIIATVPGRGYRLATSVQAAPSDAQPTTAAPVAPKLLTNLPATLPPLIGRDDDLTALEALVDRHRLVTVVGAGGIGKTLLTQHLLAAREHKQAHGVCWVELAAVTDAAALPGAIAAALGVRAGGDDAVAALARALAPLDVLVALDNAEHLLAGVAAVADALHRMTAKLRLVVTSQAPLKLAAERVIRLGPLAVPQHALPAQEALAFGAVALFVERAQAADARFVLTDAAAPAVIGLCRALDGMALAIELAAARAPTLGIQRLTSSMDERLHVLTRSRNRTAPQRQQTLRAALEWSHALLDEREQVVFRRLAAVAGSASLELIQRIAACERWNQWDVLDALVVLVERSLVTVLDAADHAAPRYRLLESPRAYAREKLHAAGESHRVQREHAGAMRELLSASRHTREMGRVPYRTSMDSDRLDIDNARDAFAWARASGERALAVELGALLIRVLPAEAQAECLALCDACEALITDDLPPALKARVWCDISTTLTAARQRRAVVIAQRAVEAARSAPGGNGDVSPLLYIALCGLATTAAMVRDETIARATVVEALALEQAAWPLPIRRWALESQVNVLVTFDSPAAGMPMLQQLIRAGQSVGISTELHMTWLVDMQLAAGDARAAVSTGQELLAQLAGSRNEYALLCARINVAAACLALDDTTQASPLLEAAWLQTRVFDQFRPALADYLALLAALDSRPAAAASLAGYADAGYSTLADVRQHNEAAAIERARTLARAVLGDAGFERMQAEGARCSAGEAAALAFGTAR